MDMVLTTPLSLSCNQILHFATPNPKPQPPTSQFIKTSQLHFHSNKTTRRKLVTSTTTSSLFFLFLTTKEAANAESPFDFLRMTVPDQTVEQAEGGIRDHALRLVQVKPLLEMGSWKEAQKELRKSCALLKQDFYTIIQAKPGIQRPALRELYSKLFNSVTRLDFAARDKDVTRVWECYADIVAALDDVFSKI